MLDFGAVALSILNFLEPWYGDFGYLLVFFGGLFENTFFLGWLLPGGTMVALGGFYTKTVGLSLPLVLILSIIGATMGKVFDFWVGYYLGKKIIKRFKLEKQEKLAEHFIKKHGARAFFLTSVVGQLRSILMITSGIVRTSFKWFLMVVAITSAIWGIVFAFLGYFLGENRKYLEQVMSYIGVFGWVIIMVWMGSMVWARVRPEKVLPDSDYETNNQ